MTDYAIPVSTVPAVISYLMTTLQSYIDNDPNPSNIYLCLGDPGMQDPPDIINISGVRRNLPHLAMVGSGGMNALEEKYDVTMMVSSSMLGTEQATVAPLVMQRAWELQAYVENTVRQDPSLGSNVLTAWPTNSKGGLPVWAPPNREGDVLGMLCEITCTINVENAL